MKYLIYVFLVALSINATAAEVKHRTDHRKATRTPIFTCTGFIEVVEGGLSEHVEYSVPGAEVTLYYSEYDQTYSAKVKSPGGSVSVFQDLTRSIYKVGGEVGGYEVVGYGGKEQGSFSFRTGVGNLYQKTFQAKASAAIPERGWSNMRLSCSGSLN